MSNRFIGLPPWVDEIALHLCPTPAGRHSFPALMSGPRRLDPDRAAQQLPRLYRAARAWTRSREEAEDLVQETYARVLARPRLIRGEDEVGYLFRALRNTPGLRGDRRAAAGVPRRPRRSRRHRPLLSRSSPRTGRSRRHAYQPALS